MSRSIHRSSTSRARGALFFESSDGSLQGAIAREFVKCSDFVHPDRTRASHIHVVCESEVRFDQQG